MMFLLLTLLAALASSATSGFPTEAPTVGPMTIPAYQFYANRQYSMMAAGHDGFLAEMPYMSTYDDCVEACESKGTGCWGFLMVEYNSGESVCQFMAKSEPSTDDAGLYWDSPKATIYRKITQVWDEESERCMGLAFDPNTFTLSECRSKCALDSQCEVYQWYWKSPVDEAGHGECFRGNDVHDCSKAHALDGFEVVEGYRKQASSERRVLAALPSSATSGFPTEAPTAGPMTIPAYQFYANRQYSMMAAGHDGFLAQMPYMSTYDDCVKACESKGTGCWGFLMVEYDSGESVCQFIAQSEPSTDDAGLYWDSPKATIYRKITQVWDEESERCMGLSFDPNTFTLSECRSKCALDSQCDVYQWYWKSPVNEAGHGECFRGKDVHDCSKAHALDGFEVVEGYRKQAETESGCNCGELYFECNDMTSGFRQCSDDAWRHDCINECPEAFEGDIKCPNGFNPTQTTKAEVCASSERRALAAESIRRLIRRNL